MRQRTVTTSPRRVELELFGHVPLVHVVLDADRTGDDPADARGHHGQRVAEEEEDEGLVLGEDLLHPIVGTLALALQARPPSALEELVDLGVGVGDEIELVGPVWDECQIEY